MRYDDLQVAILGFECLNTFLVSETYCETPSSKVEYVYYFAEKLCFYFLHKI